MSKLSFYLPLCVASLSCSAQANCVNNTNPSWDCSFLQITADNQDIQIHPSISVSAPPGGTSIALWNTSGVSGTTVVNQGTINANFYDSDVALLNSGNMVALVNAGTIQGLTNGIDNFGTLDTLTNTGFIGSAYNRGLYNTGQVTTLNNAQGGDAPLRVYGNLPIQYNLIINNQSSGGYGVLLYGGGGTDTMAFNIYGNTGTTLVGGVAASSVAAGTYYDVLQGFTSLNHLTGTSGSYGGLNYQLVADTANAGFWNLVFSLPASNINAGNTYQSSDLLSSVNPVFDGGTLQVSGATTIPTAFTVSSQNGAIDQNGHAANFSGAIVGTGKLTIVNTGAPLQGSVTLSGNNTYSGGTEVDAGANLVINDPANLGAASGTLSLVGSATVPAVLTTTRTMTLTNPITVAYDPTFNVAPGTTLTVSSVIGDGGAAGDVVVDGGGTLALTNANTYTGPTTVNAGSTLALVGNGSVATSSAVTNNGSFDLSRASAPVTLGGTYTQGSTGTLALGLGTGGTVPLTVAGTAQLAGNLSLVAGSGQYAIGRYTLIQAQHINGQFASFTSNLASLTPLGVGLDYTGTGVYLSLAPNAQATQTTLQQNAESLGALMGVQRAALQNALGYDCTLFGKNDLCLRVGGRSVQSPSGNFADQGASLTLAYRPTSRARIGAFVEQGAYLHSPAGIHQNQVDPTAGLFANWQRQEDGQGWNLGGSLVFSNSDLNLRRSASALTEGGQGNSRFNGQAYQLQARYVQPLSNGGTVAPYLGVRYSRLRRSAYGESGASQVMWPVSFASLTQKALSLIAGAEWNLPLSDRWQGSARMGVEQVLHDSLDALNGTSSIPGLSSFSEAMPDRQHTLGSLGVGLAYRISPTARLSLSGAWQQQMFGERSLTVLTAAYSLGF